MIYWIEDGDNFEDGFCNLSKAKSRARTLMRRRQKQGSPMPFVQVVAEDESMYHHFSYIDQCWIADPH
jgi:hypothetical protein